MVKVLIVEDELMIADMTEEVLVQNGYEVCGIARTVGEAVSLARLKNPDLAIIDRRLADGGLGTEVAAQLRDIHALGILYVTGNGSHTLTDGHACIMKPYRSEQLLRALDIVSELVRSGTTTLPFPPGFWLLPNAARAVQKKFFLEPAA